MQDSTWLRTGPDSDNHESNTAQEEDKEQRQQQEREDDREQCSSPAAELAAEMIDEQETEESPAETVDIEEAVDVVQQLLDAYHSDPTHVELSAEIAVIQVNICSS